jgi:hypothetical protein
VVGSTQALPMHWNGGRQQLPLQQGPSQQPSLGQQLWPGRQHRSHSASQRFSTAQQVSSSTPSTSP